MTWLRRILTGHNRKRCWDYSLAFTDEEYEAMHDAVCNGEDMRDLVEALFR